MKVLLSLACAGAIMAAPAAAADLLGTSPPLTLPESQGPPTFELGTNWYVRGDLGITFDRAPSVTFPNIALPALGAVGAPLTIGNGANWTTTNFTGGAGFGYRWNDWLRFDATWDYRTGPGGSRQATVVCPYGLTAAPTTGVPLGFLYDTTNTCNASASVRQYDNAFLANAYFDLGTYYGFTPYVGGGLGLNMDTLTATANYNETANGQPYAANLTPVGGFPPAWVNAQGQTLAPQPNVTFAPQFWDRSIRTTTWSMAWALAAGVGYRITPSMTLDIGYRYLNSGTVNTLLNPQSGATIRQTNASQQFRVGVLYYLQ
jgi:opacity protein-like surface antigen